MTSSVNGNGKKALLPKKPTINVENLNKELREEQEKMKAARLLAICLDDSDDENMGIKLTEESRKSYEPFIQHLLRERSFLGKMLWRRKRSENDPAVRKRLVAKGKLKEWTATYEATTDDRAKFNISSYGFRGSASASAPHAISIISSAVSWSAEFKMMPKLKEEDIYKALQYNELQCVDWWNRKGTNTDGWSDMRKLARKVVFISEKIHSFKLQELKNLQHLINIGEHSREITFYLLTLISTFPEKSDEILRVFEYTAPIFFLLSRIVDASLVIAKEFPDGVIENERLGRQLRLIDICIRELRIECYMLGKKLNFNAREYLKQSDDLIMPENEKSKEFSTVMLMGCLTVDTEQRAQMLENLHVNQLRVEQSSSGLADVAGSEVLDFKELENLGLKRIAVVEETGLLKGEGGYASVYEMKRADSSEYVAVKIFVDGNGAHKRILREASIWINLKHKQTLPLIGFTVLQSIPQPCLVSKLCWGNLKDYIKYRSKRSPLSIERKIQFIRDVIYGLDYLHGQDIAHGDLRAVNVLVTEDSDDERISSAVLNDFGMSDDTNQEQARIINLTSINQRTNDCWIAPELMHRTARNGIKSRVSKAGDVYALGVVFLEVVCEKEPYEDHPYYIQIAKINGELPAMRDKLQVDDSHWQFMERCWKAEDERWNIAQAGVEILLMLNSHIEL